MKAQGYEIGNSLLDADRLDFCRSIMEEGEQAAGSKAVLPVDIVVAKEFSDDSGA